MYQVIVFSQWLNLVASIVMLIASIAVVVLLIRVVKQLNTIEEVLRKGNK